MKILLIFTLYLISDRRSKVLSVRISDVREDDGGVYFCGAGIGTTSVIYSSFFTEIQLQVYGPTTTMKPSTASTTTSPRRTSTTASYRSPTRAPPTTASNRSTSTGKSAVTDEEHFSSSVIIITVCVCVALLLIGGSALIYKLRCKKTDSGFFSRQSRTNEKADDDYETDPPENRNIVMSPVYQSLNPNTNQSDSAYQSLNPNTNQSNSAIQRLDPRTREPDSNDHSLKPSSTEIRSISA
ncbi:uncharacterized protein LOC119264708 [Pygocentrus nattereri]|uniref:uncharacterized protein LOC119264708 n=1 Tax=Pygocentrus nattereri TaxID=42514 RepID=UPI0018916069|nr:uncharacterized protein LOC119264708 [Pygocentrus nattereri]